MLPSSLAGSQPEIRGSKLCAVFAADPFSTATACRVATWFLLSSPVAAWGDAAFALTSARAGGSGLSRRESLDVRSTYSLPGLLDELTNSERKPCRRSDAGFSRMGDWRRWCMGFYFNSSWNDSPFAVGSVVFVC